MSGIFCLEGDWSNDLTERSTVRPILDLLDNYEKTKIIHRNVGTKEEFYYYCNKWILKRYDELRIGYFAFHGEAGAIKLGNKKISLEEIGELLKGQCRGKVIYFGSCSVLSIDVTKISDFKKITKAKCVCGYNKDVDWMMSCAFDLLLFDSFSYYDYSPAQTLKYLKKVSPGLLDNLDFVMC